MSITIEIPPELERKLRAELPNLEAEAKQACALSLFRSGHLTHAELSEVLGIDRLETDAILQRNHVWEGSLGSDDVEDDRRTLDDLFKRKP